MSKNISNVVHYNPSRYNNQEEQDGASMVSLLLCSGGMFLRSKIMIWVAIFFLLSTFSRKKNGSSISQYLINIVMIIFSLVSIYMLVPNEVHAQKVSA
jgi:hypothetical protein